MSFDIGRQGTGFQGGVKSPFQGGGDGAWSSGGGGGDEILPGGEGGGLPFSGGQNGQIFPKMGNFFFFFLPFFSNKLPKNLPKWVFWAFFF